MAEHVPTTSEVRERHGSAWSAPYADELKRDFDAWLEAHDREVAGKALREAADFLSYDLGGNSSVYKLRARADRIERGE